LIKVRTTATSSVAHDLTKPLIVLLGFKQAAVVAAALAEKASDPDHLAIQRVNVLNCFMDAQGLAICARSRQQEDKGKSE